MTNREFERVYYPRYRDVIEAIARKLARDDGDLWDDLVSVGTVGLLELDPARARSNVDAYIRNILRNKMVDHLRWLNRRDFERLDSYLRHGHDVVLDPILGEPTLVHGDNELVPVTSEDGSLRRYTSRAQRLAVQRENGDTVDDVYDR